MKKSDNKTTIQKAYCMADKCEHRFISGINKGFCVFNSECPKGLYEVKEFIITSKDSED